MRRADWVLAKRGEEMMGSFRLWGGLRRNPEGVKAIRLDGRAY